MEWGSGEWEGRKERLLLRYNKQYDVAKNRCFGSYTTTIFSCSLLCSLIN